MKNPTSAHMLRVIDRDADPLCSRTQIDDDTACGCRKLG
jgi:hypothetical protein